MNNKEKYKRLGWSFDLVPLIGKYCRYFVKKGAVTKFNRGFRSRKEVDDWIEGFEDLIEEQDSKILRIRLKDSHGDIYIVNKHGEVYQRCGKRRDEVDDNARD